MDIVLIYIQIKMKVLVSVFLEMPQIIADLNLLHCKLGILKEQFVFRSFY